MSDEIVSAVVPSGGGVPDPARLSSSRGVVRSLPVAETATPPVAPSTVYGMGRVDASGRVAERSVIQALGWQPGDRVSVSLVDGSVLIRPDAAGVFVLPGRPYVVLPARVRLRCGVRVGDQVLLAAWPDRGVLLVHPLAVVEEMLAGHHAALLGGERS